MDHHVICIEDGNKYNHSEMPQLSNSLMCVLATVLLTFVGLIQYSVTIIVE
jgi:hypothetical protein